ncbi:MULTISPECIES: phytoene synthase [Rhodanobacter]|uniref:phytoene synthase n=1 Tax=unclassified Rhodanobacter TaxID=2621553 RepID=UPI0007A9DA36|nr:MULTISPECIES: phytoene synthase [unclassified Rhodanobacter]KZC16414.1 phytoene synthase [Rhodanobacter sp. FW104-R8]KZC25378.1 phytoene synthase [Rhodanobacter sp. FW510-T8]KZC31428.1 phytoene synthase [Rhodanobacter sp. FW510-R10]
MIELVEQNAVLQGFIDKWLAVQPQQRVALAFVDGRRYPGHVALAALEQELLGAAYGIREPQVAVAKLNWWAEELAGASASGGRHPLTQVLFDEERAHALAGELWLAPVLAAMAQLEQGTAADFPAQVEAALPLHGALAALETAWWYGADASPERASRVAVLNHLLYALLRLEQDVERDRLPLPMARLARHGLGRAQLRTAGAARQQAIRAQLDDLLASWKASAALAGPLSVFRALESRHASGLARRAARAGDALAVLRAGQARTGLATALQAWQAARAWRR